MSWRERPFIEASGVVSEDMSLRDIRSILRWDILRLKAVDIYLVALLEEVLVLRKVAGMALA